MGVNPSGCDLIVCYGHRKTVDKTAPRPQWTKSKMPQAKTISPDELLALLAAAIKDAPRLNYGYPLSDDDLSWLGRAEALIEAAGYMPSLVDFRFARDDLGTYTHDRSSVLAPLHAAYGRVELQASRLSKGTFIPPGETWNGYSAIVKILQEAKKDILVVDPYLDASFFLDFAPICPHGSLVRCLSTKRSEFHGGLVAASNRWEKDRSSDGARIEVRYVSHSALHDRAIILETRVWLVSQSIKDIAKKSPASVSLADDELGRMKASHYDQLWSQGQST